MALSSLYIFREDHILSVGCPTFWCCYGKDLEWQTPFLIDNIAQVVSQSRFSVPGQDRSPLKMFQCPKIPPGFHKAKLHETDQRALYCLLVMGHSISVNLVINTQKFRAARDFRDDLVNSFSLKVKKVETQRVLKTCPQAIELVTRKLACPFLPAPTPSHCPVTKGLCHQI